MYYMIYIMYIIEIIALSVGWYTYRHLPRPFRIVVIYISISTIIGMLARTLAIEYGNNYIAFHFYTPIELIIITLFIITIINTKTIKFVSGFVLVLYLIIWIVSKFTFESFNQIDNITGSLSNAIILVLATYAIFKTEYSSNNTILKNPYVITLVGIILYYGGNLFVYALFNNFNTYQSVLGEQIWIIHNVLHGFLDISFIYSFYLFEKMASNGD